MRGTAAIPIFAAALLPSMPPLALAVEKPPASPTQLAEQLASPDMAVRREASLALKNLGTRAKEALPALINALSDNDKQVWTNAVGAIAAIGPDAKEAIPALLRDLNSKTTSPMRSRYRDQTIVRDAYALTRIGPAALPGLIDGLRGPDTMLRIGCARALAGMGPAASEAVPALLENLGHGDPGVQREIIEALGAIGAAAKPKLVEALNGKEATQRTNAALSLGAMGQAAQDAANAMFARLKVEADHAVRASLLTALPRVGPDASELVPALIEGLKDENDDVRHACINSLLVMRAAQPQIVNALTAMVQDANAATSERAAYVLGRLGESAAPAVPAIVAAAAKQSEPSQTLIDALVQIGEPAVTPMLVRYEKIEPATITREHWVVRTLQQMGGLAAKPIARSLNHPSAAVRLLAARALMELGADAEPAIPALTVALDDADVRVQAAALVALVSARAPLEQVAPRIHAAFKSSSVPLRAGAVEAAVRLGPDGKEFRETVIAALSDSDESIRKAVIEHLDASFADAVPALTSMLDDPARRGAVTEALGRIGPDAKPAVPKLASLLAAGSPEERLHVLTALEHIGAAAKEALPALETARQDKDARVRIAAINAAAAIETDKARSAAALIAGLSDADRNVRRAIAESIARMGNRAVDTAPKLIELVSDDGDREFALAALSQINMRDVPKLMELLHHPQHAVQLFACRRLENIGRRAKEAVPALDQIAASSPDQELARAARRAARAITVK